MRNAVTSLTGLIGTSTSPDGYANGCAAACARTIAAYTSSPGSAFGVPLGCGGYSELTHANPCRTSIRWRSARSRSPFANPPGVRNPAGVMPHRSRSASVADSTFCSITSGTVLPRTSQGARRKRNCTSSIRAASRLTWS